MEVNLLKRCIDEYMFGICFRLQSYCEFGAKTLICIIEINLKAKIKKREFNLYEWLEFIKFAVPAQAGTFQSVLVGRVDILQGVICAFLLTL